MSRPPVMQNWGLHRPDATLKSLFNDKREAIKAAYNSPADWFAQNEKNGVILYISNGAPPKHHRLI